MAEMMQVKPIERPVWVGGSIADARPGPYQASGRASKISDDVR
jgi:hypothetical protein